MPAPERRRAQLWWGLAALALVAVAVGALALGPATAGTTQKGLTKAKADKLYLGNTTSATTTSTVPANTGAVLTVLCPAGRQALDGGAESPATFTSPSSDIMAIAESYPVFTGSRATGWTVEVITDSAAPITVTAHAVCAP